LLYALHVVAGIGLVLSIRCLAEEPGVLVCQWGKTVGNTFGQVSAFVIWGLLTWHVWLPRGEKTTGAPGEPTVGRDVRVRNPVFAAACGIAALTLFVAYSNHFANGFHFDDSAVIVDNLSIRSLGNTGKFFTDPHTFSTQPENAVYRPLLTLSHALDWAMSGSRARQFHRTQFALLVALGAALVFLFRRLYDLGRNAPENRYVALFAALLFCVHAANTGTVNDISARADLVATLAIAVCFCLYLAWPERRRTNLFLLPMLVGALASPLTADAGRMEGRRFGAASLRAGTLRRARALRVSEMDGCLHGVLHDAAAVRLVTPRVVVHRPDGFAVRPAARRRRDLRRGSVRRYRLVLAESCAAPGRIRPGLVRAHCACGSGTDVLARRGPDDRLGLAGRLGIASAP